MPPDVSRTGARAVLVQQSIRRLPALPGIWKHHRFRFESDYSGQIKITEEGAIDPWTGQNTVRTSPSSKRSAKALGVPLDVPWHDLTSSSRRRCSTAGIVPGIHGFFEFLERKKYKLHVRVMLSKYRGYALCPECKGQRLRAEARASGFGQEYLRHCGADDLRRQQLFRIAEAHSHAGTKLPGAF